MECQNCHATALPTALFCSQCGSRVARSASLDKQRPVLPPGEPPSPDERSGERLSNLRAEIEKLRAELEFTKHLIDTAPVIVLVLDLEGRIQHMNRYLEQLSGYGLAEVRGRDWFSLFLPESDRERIQFVFRTALHQKPTRGNRNSILTRSGESRVIEWYDDRLRDAAGQVVGLVSVGQDVTDRERFLKELHESEGRLRLALASANQGLWDLDVQTGYAVVTPEYATMLGYDPGVFEETHEQWLERMHPDDLERVNAIYEAYMSGAISEYSAEFRQRTTSGDWKWILSKGKTVAWNRAGQPLRMVGTHTDISAVKESAERLRASESRLAEAQRLAKVGSWELDLATDKLVWSAEVFRMFEVDPDTFGASNQAFLDAIHPEDRDRVNQAYQDSLKTRQPYEITHRLRMADGSTKWVHERCETTFDASGRPLRSIGTVQDITERHQFEQAVRESELRYRKLFETSPDAILVLDSAGRVRSANESAARMLGYRVDELMGMPIQDLSDPEGAARVPGRMRQLLAGDSLLYEALHRRKDGSYFPVEVVATTMRIGEETFFLSFDRDITERKSTQEQLRRREELFRLVWDNAADGMRLTDAAGTVIAVNPAFCRMVGKPREEIEGQPLADVYAASDRSFITEDYLKHFTSREFLTFSERKMLLFDGREIWMELSSRITSEAERDPLLVTVFRDITSRKQVESALAESRERFREIAETVTEVFWSADATTSKIDYVSPSYERVWGRTCESLYQDPRSFLESIHPLDRDRIQQDLLKKLAGLPFEHEYRVVRPDGVLRWIWDRGFPVQNSLADMPARYVGVATDITERKLAENALRTHSEMLLNMSDAVTFIDHQGVIRLTNRAFDAMFGYEPGELIGRPVTLFSDATADENQQLLARAMESTAATGSWSGEVRNRRKDGSTFWTATRISRLEQPGGASYISIQEDITARKQRDEMQAALREQLAHSSRLGMLGEMATGLAHELNQPLTALHLYASIGLQLSENLQPSQLKDCLEKISSESLRAGEIIRRIRAFAARSPARHSPLDLNKLIHEVLAILTLELRHKNAKVTLHLQAGLPWISADAIQIQQVLVNLIRNALEAMSHLESEQRCLTIATSAEEDRVRVSVQDTGMGFEASKADELFQAFHTTKPAGLGLGLMISRSLIEAHGGRIGAESHLARGATFFFELPQCLQK